VPATAVLALRRRLDLPGPYLMWCGTHEPRKNLATLLRAFEQLVAAGRDLHLLLVGPEGWGPQAAPPAAVASRVRAAGFLSPADLHAAYAGAAVLAYPSLREGFGMPCWRRWPTGSRWSPRAAPRWPSSLPAPGSSWTPSTPVSVAAGVDAALADAPALSAAGRRPPPP
jgi:glycosyltransferase involved in cell wall biosynthesis